MEETNILVVDDEKEIADLLEIYLISDGFQVLKAYSAKLKEQVEAKDAKLQEIGYKAYLDGMKK